MTKVLKKDYFDKKLAELEARIEKLEKPKPAKKKETK